MNRRLPLWTALVPLVVGLVVYGWSWRSQRDQFRRDVVAVLGERQPLIMGGFPYRLAAATDRVKLERRQGGAVVQLAASRAELHRQPFRRALTVVAARDVQLYAGADALAGARLAVTAPQAQASLHRESSALVRLSLVFDQATVQLPLLPQAIAAEQFELHLREVVGALPVGQSPTPPERVQARIAGTGRLAVRGAPVVFAADLALTADNALENVDDWRRGGTLRVRTLTLTDAGGFEFARLNATLAALPSGRLAVAGTMRTSCPETLLSMFGGPSPAVEYRTRQPLDFVLSGDAAAPKLTRTSRFTSGRARNLEPPCPVLRR